MTSNPDLVIRGGNIADGKGGELFEADVAITGGRITEVGKVAGTGKEEIDARGKLVAPGFVDVHTHYDGQVTWSQDITPSSQNGVTTAIMGNCGVGFAPCRPADHFRLIQLMEGVEDIPEPVLSAGIPWAWESFPDYMGWLSKRNFDMDIGAQLPHAALRVYVMGERGARRDPATPEDNKAMAALAGDAVRSGALGFSTSRTLNHRTSTGDYTPTLKAGEDELTAIAAAMHGVGRSVLQFVLDQSTVHEDLPMMLRVAENTKCPISFSVAQADKAPRRWRQTMDTINEAAARGLSITTQIAARPVGLLLGLELSRNPFQTHPSYRAIAKLPLAERLTHLRRPEVRAAILSETATATDDPLFFRPNYDKMYLLGNPPDYEQPPENALGPQARRQGRQPEELAYDAMLTDEGRGMLYVPFLNYADGNLDAVHEMLREPSAVPGLQRRRRALRHHLRRQLPDLSADALDPRPQPRRETLDPVRGGGAVAQDRALGRSLRSRRDRPGLQGRRQRDRLRPAAPASAEGALRPSGRWSPPDATGRRLRRHHRLRRSDPAWRQGHRRAPGQTGAWHAGCKAAVGRGGELADANTVSSRP